MSQVSAGASGSEGWPSSLGGAAQAEVDGQAIQPPFTFNEREPCLLARSLCSPAFHATTDSKHFALENRQRRRFCRVSDP